MLVFGTIADPSIGTCNVWCANYRLNRAGNYEIFLHESIEPCEGGGELEENQEETVM